MSIEQEDHILQLLTRYLQGDVKDDEQKFVEDWIAESKSNKIYFGEVKHIWDTSESIADFDQINVDEQWNKFESGIIATVKKKPKSNKVYLKIAASIVFLIGLGFYFNSFFNTEVTLIAKAGIENKFILPDESIVWLNEGSQLTYKKGFKGDSRHLNLEGEGFFEVTKDPDKPFIVIANATETKVLGTSFNLKNNTKTKEVELVLVTGKVEFLSKNQKEILTPGDKITAVVSGKLIKTVNENLNFSTWKSGLLRFEKTSIEQVIKDIELYYNKNLIIESKEFVNCTLTTIFDNESLEDVLETLKILFDVTYEKIDSNTIIIKGGDCNS
ncbi:FecR family protein [Aquimarina sp. MAR_2010_214]|uniref:FecR family protein n=1 Tax=Aquimarina sp. MAR_2010_214 TaxID=1250026 RepID=UPI000C714F3B|nr:FecR family protein [Aquimarina sp. MAR_2010_214]PKV51799.1 FecR family protein [Aquimarina sp. MAR_2010_214]